MTANEPSHPSIAAGSGPQDSQHLYQKIFTYSNDAIFVIDPSADAILDVNPRACEMLGYSRDELLSMTVSAIHPDEMPRLQAFAETVFKTGRGWTNELSCLTSSGQLLPAEISASTVEIDGKTCMIAMVRDIRERREAEQALRESEERYRKVFEHSNDAIFITDDATDRILDANPRACEMLGYSHDELVKISISTIHAHEMEKMGAFARLVSEKGEGWTNELTCHTKRGTFLPCEISASTLELQGKTYRISIVRDITERKEAEESSKELAVLGERTRLAREIHDSLAQGLTGIIWQLNVLEKTAELQDEAVIEQIKRTRDLAKESLQEARRSVWDLRSSALEGLSLGEAIRKEAEKAVEGSNLKIEFEIEGEEKVLPAGIEATLFRIAQESLNNAVKHAEASSVNVRLTYNDSEVGVTVKDDGVGFDPDSRSAPGEGSRGFGMISMRERARLLGGTLTVESEPGRGTQVQARVPTGSKI